MIDTEDIEEPLRTTNCKINLFSLIFNCCNEESVSKLIFIDDLNAVILHQTYSLPETVDLFNFSFEEDLPVDIIVKMCRSNIHQLASSLLVSSNQSSNSFYSVRESVTKALLILRCNFSDLW